MLVVAALSMLYKGAIRRDHDDAAAARVGWWDRVAPKGMPRQGRGITDNVTKPVPPNL